MVEFPANPARFDPYKNFKFRLKWDGRYIAGVSRMSALRRTTEVVEHREGGNPPTSRKSPVAEWLDFASFFILSTEIERTSASERARRDLYNDILGCISRN